MWESTDLIKWTSERLVQVEDKTAGMVWAPEAIWDANKGQYLVHWASKFYAASDTAHTGTPSNIKIRFACKHSPQQDGLRQQAFVHVLTKMNRYKRLQDLQRTSNLHRLRAHQHNRPQHPALRQQRQERLPPLPQGRDAQERLCRVLDHGPERHLDAPRRQRRLHPRADGRPRVVLGQQGRGAGQPARRLLRRQRLRARVDYEPAQQQRVGERQHGELPWWAEARQRATHHCGSV